MKIFKVYFLSMVGTCVLVVLFAFSAQQQAPRRLNPVEYARWIVSPSNGLQSKVTEGSYDFIVNYLPADYMILKEFRGREFSRKQFEKRQKELKNTEYYSLLINLNNGKNNVVKSLVDEHKANADQVVKYLAYDLQREIRLVKGTDTLKCSFLHMEETYEVTSYARLTLVFDVPEEGRRKSDQDRTILATFPWLQNPDLRFSIAKKNLQNVPKVSVKK